MCVLRPPPQAGESKSFYYSSRSRIDELCVPGGGGRPTRARPSVRPANPSPAALGAAVFATGLI